MRTDTPMARRLARSVVGGVVGTVGTRELAELVALNDFRIARTKATYDAHAAEIIGKDVAWPVDWSVLRQRYDAAKAAITSKPGDDAQDDYDRVLKAVQQVPMKRSPGDLADLMARLSKAGHPVDETGTPQPGKTVSDEFMTATNAVPTPAGLFNFGTDFARILPYLALAYVWSNWK